jgi:uncharacterized protein YcfL
VKKQLFNMITKAVVASGLLLSLCFMPSVGQSGVYDSKIESQGTMLFLDVTDIRETIQNGLLHIQVEVDNKNRGNQQMFYRFKWLDAAGLVVWKDEPWKPLLIHGKQKFIFTTTAPTPKATDYRLQLQSPKNRAN